MLTADHADDKRNITTGLDDEGRRERSRYRGVQDSKCNGGSQTSVGGREGWMGEE